MIPVKQVLKRIYVNGWCPSSKYFDGISRLIAKEVNVLEVKYTKNNRIYRLR